MPRTLSVGRSLAANRVSIQNFPCSLGFNGTSSDVSISDNSSLDTITAAVTLSVWVKPYPNPAAVQGIVTKDISGVPTNAPYSITIATSGDFQFSIISSSNTGFSGTNFGIKPSWGVWQHLILVYDGANITRYVNGVLAGATPNTTNIATTTTPLWIGQQKNGFSRFFKGRIAQVGLWNRALSVSELNALYTKGLLPNNGLVAYYPLTEGAGTTAYDLSGNGNNGTITSGTYSSDVPSKTRSLINGNMVYNGNFEFAPPTNTALTSNNHWLDGTSGGSLTNNLFGWGTVGNGGTVGTLFDNSTSHSGNYALKVSTLATGSHQQVAQTIAVGTASNIINYAIKVSPSTSYMISWWMKTTANSGAATSGAGVILQEYNGAGTAGTSNTPQKITTTTDWTQYSFTWTTGSTAHFLLAECQVAGNDGTGTLIMDAWFDDIVLVPTTTPVRAGAV